MAYQTRQPQLLLFIIASPDCSSYVLFSAHLHHFQTKCQEQKERSPGITLDLTGNYYGSLEIINIICLQFIGVIVRSEIKTKQNKSRRLIPHQLILEILVHAPGSLLFFQTPFSHEGLLYQLLRKQE